MDILEQKREDDKKLVKRDDKGNSYTTSHNYFIKVKNKFLQFVRVHGVLDNLFEDTDEQKKAKDSIRNRLKDKKGKQLADEILKIQDEYNQKLADEYGKDSFAYEKYHIDLKEYTKQ
jgi:predicted metal-dependent hydrolase